VGRISTVRQFWGGQIIIAACSTLGFVVLLLTARTQVQSLPRDGLEALFTATATLLGLTFTAFSILATFIPGIRPDFVRSKTFANMGQTFLITMWVELASLLLSGLSFVVFGREGIQYAVLAALYFAILSAGYISLLMGYMFSLFEMARRSVSG
jgi:hypothetical protein